MGPHCSCSQEQVGGGMCSWELGTSQEVEPPSQLAGFARFAGEGIYDVAQRNQSHLWGAWGRQELAVGCQAGGSVPWP